MPLAALEHRWMNTKRIDRWVWLLIYAGMLLASLGVALQRGGAALGWPVVGVGGVLAVVGLALIWVRSRGPGEPG